MWPARLASRMLRARFQVLLDLRQLFELFGVHWRRRAALLALLTVVGAVAELMVIGAIVPFLAIVADPTGTRSGKAVGFLLRHLPQIAGQDRTTSLAILFIVMALVAAMIRLLLSRATFWSVYGIGHELSRAVYERIIYQPYSYHIAVNSSEAVSSINRVVDVTHNMILPLVQSFSAVVIASFIVIGLFLVDPLVAGATILCFGVLYVTPSVLIRHRLLSNGRIVAEMITTRIKTVQEGVGGIRDVLLDQAQPIYVAKFDKVDAVYHQRGRENVFIAAAPRFIVESLGMVLIAGLALYMTGRPGGVYAALPILGALAIGAQRMMPLFQSIYQSWAQIVSVRAAFDAMLDLGALPSHSQVPTRIVPFTDTITLEQVGFAYQNGLQVLDAVSLTIAKGSRVAFVGQTGSGKSTLIDIVMGLLEPGAGDVRIDGVQLDAASRTSWQANIAHVSQVIYLADTTLAENIAFGVPPEEIDLARVQQAAEHAELSSFIQSLPEGLQTGVGERGVRLSGGQRQRIGIARALYKRSPVLVLDEATSALDERTEAAVMRNLEALDAGLTVLIIAHRLSTIRQCDVVFRLDRGRIVAAGSFDDVVGTAAVKATAR